MLAWCFWAVGDILVLTSVLPFIIYHPHSLLPTIHYYSFTTSFTGKKWNRADLYWFRIFFTVQQYHSCPSSNAERCGYSTLPTYNSPSHQTGYKTNSRRVKICNRQPRLALLPTVVLTGGPSSNRDMVSHKWIELLSFEDSCVKAKLH